MTPIYEFECQMCGNRSESLMKPWERDNQPIQCPECGGKCKPVISGLGGYTIKGDNSGSVKPSQSGSFKGKTK